MPRKDVAKLFIWQGFAIGTVGISIGLAIGLLVCTVIKNYSFLPLPKGVYYLKYLPVTYLPVDYAVICSLAWVFSVVAAVYPAIVASRQDPVLGLRVH
jgi:lipoprotein-releasing system permease protein